MATSHQISTLQTCTSCCSHAFLSLIVLAIEVAAVSTGATSKVAGETSFAQDVRDSILLCFQKAWTLISQRYERIIHGQIGLSEMVQLLALCTVVHCFGAWRVRSILKEEENSDLDCMEGKASASTRLPSLNLGDSAKFGKPW